jgi:hypothetical protein
MKTHEQAMRGRSSAIQTILFLNARLSVAASACKLNASLMSSLPFIEQCTALDLKMESIVWATKHIQNACIFIPLSGGRGAHRSLPNQHSTENDIHD